MSTQTQIPTSPKTGIAIAAAIAACAIAAAGLIYASTHHGESTAAPEESVAGKVERNMVRISPEQLAALQTGPGESRLFSNTRHTLGVIDFNQDHTTRVYSGYQGRVSKVLVKAGDDVKAGQALFTVAIPDMSEAASALISASAALHNASEILKRSEALARDNSIPFKEYLQAQAEQQTAQASYDAARQKLRLFELGDADIARIERERRFGIELSVKSPMSGRVTSRAAQPGQLVQPGEDPAPIVVSDMRSLWMVANVPESDFGYYRIGQSVQVRVAAWPERIFSGNISYVGDSIDADSRRFVLRAEIPDPERVLRPQMSADFSIAIAAPQQTLAVPAQAVVREGSGTDVVWVAMGKDEKGPLFSRRTVLRGQTADGWVQILKGLAPAEPVARSNALFLSSLYETNAQ